MPPKLLPNVEHLPQPLRRFMDRMTDEQRLLLVLKRELYDGLWEPMVADLTNRLAGRPYVFKLAHRIEDDLRRIEQLRQMEAHYELDLSVLVDPFADSENRT